LTTGWGGTGRLVRQIGLARATDWLLTGRYIDVAEAESSGFVNYVVPDGSTLLALTMTLAHSLAVLPEGAVAATKNLLHAAASRPLNEVNKLELESFLDLWMTEERLRLMQQAVNRNPRSSNDFKIDGR
jgi:enoyl-CoA hydratase